VGAVPTWTHRFDELGPIPAGVMRVAVKDAIDVAGVVTTAGCVAVRDRASPVRTDASCLAGVRAAAAVIVGKTTLTELCLGPEGFNPEFGTPVNPLAPQCIPGGSSSGSAVAVAAGQADIGLGTDTGGSIRVPAACCGIVGLKTTWGRVPVSGVWPLAPSLDTVGPLARTVAGVVAGMRMIAPDWRPAGHAARVVGRLRLDGVDPDAEARVDEALKAAGLVVREVRLPGWAAVTAPFRAIILGELWREHGELLDADGVSGAVNEQLRRGRDITDDQLNKARAAGRRWRARMAAVLREVDVIATPTLAGPPPLLTDVRFKVTRLTRPVNLAGLPALAMPVRSPGRVVPVSLQLIGPAYGEELLCATARIIEEASPAGRQGSGTT
jgi:amidase